MSGLFAYFSKNGVKEWVFDELLKSAVRRGRNSSSLLIEKPEGVYEILKSDKSINEIRSRLSPESSVVIGSSGLNASQPDEITPVVGGEFVLFHDGISNSVPAEVEKFRVTTARNSEFIINEIDSLYYKGMTLREAIEGALDTLTGTMNCIMLAPKHGKIYLFSNHGSLFYAQEGEDIAVSSERTALDKVYSKVDQIKGVVEFDVIARADEAVFNTNILFKYEERLPMLSRDTGVLKYEVHSLIRCSKCILPETMPFIRFDAEGVCNYCHSYKKRNQPKNKQKLHELVEPYRRKDGYDCIVPFSGGRDSCFALHLIANELKLKPITYTYDWGMVTDVGRRNIALMCGALGVENIVVADDIEKKRRNIAMNFSAWLKNPHLGMLNILTAGDKHFFRYVNKVKEDTGISLNMWGVNPLEVTHFKTGFLGIEPDFERQRVYASGKMGQLRYQSKRLQQMLKSPGYFNRSLWDTWTGEYYRSAAKKTDYFHVFDYWQWSEQEINSLLAEYEWELATDTPTTWRIGDGTAGIYNYIYYTLAGFTEHDTFRSNQVREGELTRDEALRLVELENAPCYENIRWYLASIGFDFSDTIKRINAIPRLHEMLY